VGDLSGQALRPARPIAKEPLVGERVWVKQTASLAAEPSQDPGTVVEQAAVGRVMDVRLNHGGIRPQLVAGGYSLHHGELHEPIIQAVQGPRLNQVFAVAQGTMIGHGVVVNPAEPAPFGVADDLVMGRRIAPAHQVTHHTRAQRHLDRRRGAAIPRRLRCREQEIVGGLQDQLGIV
jgi:hypothetical protein